MDGTNARVLLPCSTAVLPWNVFAATFWFSVSFNRSDRSVEPGKETDGGLCEHMTYSVWKTLDRELLATATCSLWYIRVLSAAPQAQWPLGAT